MNSEWTILLQSFLEQALNNKWDDNLYYSIIDSAAELPISKEDAFILYNLLGISDLYINNKTILIKIKEKKLLYRLLEFNYEKEEESLKNKENLILQALSPEENINNNISSEKIYRDKKILNRSHKIYKNFENDEITKIDITVEYDDGTVETYSEYPEEENNNIDDIYNKYGKEIFDK